MNTENTMNTETSANQNIGTSAHRIIGTSPDRLIGHIRVLTENEDVLAEKHFYSRMHYNNVLAELMECFKRHRIEITFESRM